MTKLVKGENEYFTLFFSSKSPLSNFQKCSFSAVSIDGKEREFTSTEQFFMYNKALAFKDHETAEKMLEIDDPKKIKKLGRKVAPFDKDRWNGIREGIMKKGLTAKFSQVDHLRNSLFSTSGSRLVECSPFYRVWGIGLSMTNPNASKPERWRGQNKLGKLLTEVRDELWEKEEFVFDLLSILFIKFSSREERKQFESQLEQKKDE